MTSFSFEYVEALCRNVDELTEFELVSKLEAILETNSDVVDEKDDTMLGCTLVHHAAQHRSPEFCKLLVDMNPDLVKSVTNNTRLLPFHLSCLGCNVETAKYLYHIYPESINIPDRTGGYPLHIMLSRDTRMLSCDTRNEEAIELTQFLLEYDQGTVSKSNSSGRLPLHMACQRWGLDIVKLIFNAYPEAIHIRDNRNQMNPLDYARRNRYEYIRSDLPIFLERQIDLERQAQKDRTPDNDGRLPIHRALQDRDTSVGPIKLMVAANPASIAIADKQGLTLLHHACQRGNIDIVKYIMAINDDSLKVPDLGENLPLHHACMRGNCDLVPLIIEQSPFGVMLQNSTKQIPIELLLFESQCDRDSIEYVEAVRCLLGANPVGTLKCLTCKDKEQDAGLE